MWPKNKIDQTYNMGLIGNCSFMAHASTRGNIEWMCWPDFDSEAVFGKLLDEERGGEFSIRPDEPYESHQYYLENTNILVTEMSCASGSFRVIDFAPRFHQFNRHYRPRTLYRVLEPIEGRPRIKIVCEPKGNYGLRDLDVSESTNHLTYYGLPKPIRLYSTLPLSFVNDNSFPLSEKSYLAMTWDKKILEDFPGTVENDFRKTKEYWQGFVLRTTVGQFQQKSVIRSALAVKLHQFEDTGAIVAAPTTSLPECDQSGRNWDYRFCWLRDSYYVLKSLTRLGRTDELHRYEYYMHNIASQPTERFQPLYSIKGEAKLTEMELDLAGFLDNQPVRVGNQAYTHIQNDVYGQMLLSIFPLFTDRRITNRRGKYDVPLLKSILQRIEKVLDEPDAGLWEFRTLEQFHTYTYLFHWAGCKAVETIAKDLEDEELLSKSQELIAKCDTWIEKAYDPELKTYTQAVGSRRMDASLLQMISMRYLDPQSEKAKNLMAAIERELLTEDGLVYRYKHEDDFGKPKTTFLICAFWYVEALATMGRTEDAVRVYERLVGTANHVGLLSEDVDSTNNRQWGNFPQAYSHVGLINAAKAIERALDCPAFLGTHR